MAWQMFDWSVAQPQHLPLEYQSPKVSGIKMNLAFRCLVFRWLLYFTLSSNLLHALIHVFLLFKGMGGKAEDPEGWEHRHHFLILGWIRYLGDIHKWRQWNLSLSTVILLPLDIIHVNRSTTTSMTLPPPHKHGHYNNPLEHAVTFLSIPVRFKIILESVLIQVNRHVYG